MGDPKGATARHGVPCVTRELGPHQPLLDRVCRELSSGDAISDESMRRMLELISRFLSFVHRGWRIARLEDVAPHHVLEFVRAPLAGSVPARAPSVATSHLRRSAVRLLFRVLRQFEIVTIDPTVDIALPPRSSLSARPLTDDEIAVCRSYSLRTLAETRQPAAWALAEATARTSEIPRIRFADLDFKDSRVWIPGGTKTEPRYGILTPWGATQLRRRQESVAAKSHDTRPVVFAGRQSTRSGQASSCIAISETLVRAGLGAESDVRPVSVAAWAGVAILRESGRIENAARRLGLRSLDRTAQLLGFDWASESLPGR